MIEAQVSIQSNDIELKGNLILPAAEGKFPAVLYISGSGPIDRDDNIPGLAMGNSKTIAHYLADRGFASLRYDKRGVGESGGDHYCAGHRDLVDDAGNCAAYLLEHDRIVSDRVFVVGHSEGTIIAAQVSQAVEKVAGIILLAPFCADMESTLTMQAASVKQMVRGRKGLRSLPMKALTLIFDPVRSQQKLIRKIKASRKDTFRAGMQKVPGKWLRELLALNLEAIFKQTVTPALLIGGEKDFQCDPADVGRIKNMIGGPVEGYVIENMSHLLRPELGEPTIFNYSEQLEHEIVPEVLSHISAWLDKYSAV